VTVYQLIKNRFREWSQVPKTSVPDLDVPLSEFLKDKSERAKKILQLYLRLRKQGKITKPPDRLSLPYTHKQERALALSHRIYDVVFSGLDLWSPVYEVMYGIHSYQDSASGDATVQYPHAVEVIAVPFAKEKVEENPPDAFKSLYIVGAINYSVSPGQIINTFQGHYRPYNKKTKQTAEGVSNIIHVFEAFGFNFRHGDSNRQQTKLPCVIAVNLISPVLSYTSEGKSNIDITPFRKTIEAAVEKVANRVKTFKAAGIVTEDLLARDRYAKAKAEQRSAQRQLRQYEKIQRQKEREERREARVQEQEEKQKKREEKIEKFKNLYEITEEILLQRIREFRAAGNNPEIFAKKIVTQDTGVWYKSLALLAQNRIEESPKVRAQMKKYIREVCKKHGVSREQIGIIAGARAAMYYNGEFTMVSYYKVEELAMNGTDVVFIEKMGMVESFRWFADKSKIALVTSTGQLTLYAKQLSELAIKSGGHVHVVVDYDISGIIIASKLGPNVPWLGVNKKWIEDFNIPLPTEPDKYGAAYKVYRQEETRRRVVPYTPKGIPMEKEKLRRLIEQGEKEVEDEETGEKSIVKDTRFSPDKVDLDWLWVRDYPYTKDTGKKGRRIEGHKIEIDAVVEDQGAEKVWQYLLDQIKKEREKRDYTRVMPSDIYKEAPEPPHLDDSVSASSDIDILTFKLHDYLKDRTSEITRDKRDKTEEELKNYKGIIPDVTEKEQEIRQSIRNIVRDDPTINDIVSTINDVKETIEEEEGLSDLQEQIEDIASKVNEAIINAIRKLDAEKGYGIMKALGLEEGV
jgi:hypothetical protein